MESILSNQPLNAVRTWQLFCFCSAGSGFCRVAWLDAGLFYLLMFFSSLASAEPKPQRVKTNWQKQPRAHIIRLFLVFCDKLILFINIILTWEKIIPSTLQKGLVFTFSFPNFYLWLNLTSGYSETFCWTFVLKKWTRNQWQRLYTIGSIGYLFVHL